MNIEIDVRELAQAVLPHRDEGMLAMLWGYFDESGMNNQRDSTVVAGFFGPMQCWSDLQREWKRELSRVGVNAFHYTECRGRNHAYKNFDKHRQQSHLENLAEIISNSGLAYVSALFQGDYGKVLSEFPNAKIRFPHPYSICFELLVQDLISASRRATNPESIVLIFEEQGQFQKRALETYNLFKFNNLWPEIVSVIYSSSKSAIGLQVADMLAWEVGRYLFRSPTKSNQNDFPLIKRLLNTESIYPKGSIGVLLTEEKVCEMFRSPGRQLVIPPSLT